MSKQRRIKSLLGDDDFLSVVSETRDALTKKVMRKATSDEERLQALAEYHALDTLMARMRNHAQNAKDDD